MQTETAVVERDPDSCFRAFVDASTFAIWVPGLRRARVVATDAAGRAAEIAFELGASRTYSLVYTYDAERREVTWAPRANGRDAVAGFARFETNPDGAGTKITYGLANHASDPGQGEIEAILSAFTSYVLRRR